MIETEFKYEVDSTSAKRYIEELSVVGVVDSNEGILDIVSMEQFYLADADNVAIRGRISTNAKGETSAVLAIKSANGGSSRLEIEKELTMAEAMELSKLAISRLTKTRYIINCRGSIWDFDVFTNELEGKVYAEIELDSEHDVYEMISCAGMQLVDGREHSNAYLADLVSKSTSFI